jgi:hypothetical protein
LARFGRQKYGKKAHPYGMLKAFLVVFTERASLWDAKTTHFRKFCQYILAIFMQKSEILSLKTPILTRFWPWQRI